MLINADLHIHAAGDPFDLMAYTPRDVVDRAVSLGIHCIAITNHRTFTWTEDDAAYARARGVLMIPGIEVNLQGRDVVILNASADAELLRSFDDLRAYRAPHRLILAPHPFYPTPYSLNDMAAQTIDLYDAIELSACYLRWHGRYNRLARAFAVRHGLPLVASSDAHGLWMMGTSWSKIETLEFTADGVIEAIKHGAIRPVMRPMSHFSVFRFLVIGSWMRACKRQWRRTKIPI